MATYKGDIERFPQELVELMLKEQVAAGNKEDITVFEKSKFAAKPAGGFYWSKAKFYDVTFYIRSIGRNDFNYLKKHYKPQYIHPITIYGTTFFVDYSVTSADDTTGYKGDITLKIIELEGHDIMDIVSDSFTEKVIDEIRKGL